MHLPVRIARELAKSGGKSETARDSRRWRYEGPVEISPEFALLASCCRWNFPGGDRRAPAAGEAVDWHRFLRLARFHRVEGLAWRAFGSTALAPPGEVAEALSSDADRIAAANLRAAAECRRLRMRFSEAGVPLLVHEQNRAPGMTNRVLARIARRTLCGFPGAFAREEVVGNPVREVIAALPPPQQRLHGRSGPLRLLVLGGSQGARALNDAVPTALAALSGLDVEVRHQCGERLREEAHAAYAAAGVQASVEAFISDMAQAYAWADLVVCRAGASTLAELCAAGVGSVLVPFAAAVDDHQTRNAEYLVEHDAAVLLKQGPQLAVNLQGALRALAADPARRLAMAVAARGLARTDAARRIAAIVLEESLPSPDSPATGASA